VIANTSFEEPAEAIVRTTDALRMIALLGRRDQPTDAVEEYCRLLGTAIADHSFQVELRRVTWDQHGWAASLDALKLQADAWRDTWVLVQ